MPLLKKSLDSLALVLLCTLAVGLLAVLFFRLFTTLPAGLALGLGLTHLVIAVSFGLLLGLIFRYFWSLMKSPDSETASQDVG